MPLVVFALKEIGKENITAKDLEQIQKVLLPEDKEVVLFDAYLAPRWITDIILSLKLNG